MGGLVNWPLAMGLAENLQRESTNRYLLGYAEGGEFAPKTRK